MGAGSKNRYARAMNPWIPFLTGLTLVASLSPLLTFARLWQIKEWRLDRLREHMRHEGCLRAIIGLPRAILFITYAVVLVSNRVGIFLLITATLTAFVVLTIIQFALKKQHMPVWTGKAAIVVGMALAINAIAATTLQTTATLHLFLPLLPLLQPIVLAGTLALFWPVDTGMKQRIMRRAAALRAAHPELTVIGITGSAGKTTTKELLAHILQPIGAKATPVHMNTEIGVARWMISLLTYTAEPPLLLIVEMGAYRTGEIDALCRITKPSIGVVTFVGKQHVALFGSQEALCKAKGELVRALPAHGHAFLNADSAMCAKLANDAACTVVTVGTGGNADREAFDIEETINGIRFRDHETVYEVPLHGTHNVTNILLAIAVARHLGLQPKHIAQRLHTAQAPTHTFCIEERRGVTVLDDTHNASPTSAEAAIAWAEQQQADKRTLLLSGLIELGAERSSVYMQLGSLAANVFQRVIFVNPNGKEDFEKGYGAPIEQWSKRIPPVAGGSILACVGRMNAGTIEQMLPPA